MSAPRATIGAPRARAATTATSKPIHARTAHTSVQGTLVPTKREQRFMSANRSVATNIHRMAGPVTHGNAFVAMSQLRCEKEYTQVRRRGSCVRLYEYRVR
jgi:hypothetical protein